MLLSSNADVMAALQAYYVKLLDNEDFPIRKVCHKSIQNFATDIESNIVWTRMQVRRLKLLAEIIDGRKDLVCPTIRGTSEGIISNDSRFLNTFRIRSQKGQNS